MPSFFLHELFIKFSLPFNITWIGRYSIGYKMKTRILVKWEPMRTLYTSKQQQQQKKLKVGLIRTPFPQRLLKVEQNGFHQWKLYSKTNKLNDFHRILKIESCRKITTKIITVRKMVQLWIHSSVATLEAHKSESGVETKCYEYKRNTIRVLLEWFLTTRMAATTAGISIFTLSLLKIRAVFWMFPNVCLLISQRWKKISTNGFHHCKLHLWKKLGLELERNRTKLRY